MNTGNYDCDLVLYDFCGTIVDMQTANAYVRYVKRKLNIRNGLVESLRIFLNKIGFIKRFNYIFPRMAVNKSLLLYQIKGVEYERLDALAKSFYEEEVKPQMINTVLETIKMHQEKRDKIAIVSAGYDIYLKYFAEEYNIPVLIATQLAFKDHKSTGTIKGKDNFGKEKVKNVYTYFGEEHISSFARLVGYSDSDTDLPILNICSKKVCVNKGDKAKKWMIDLGANIICY